MKLKQFAVPVFMLGLAGCASAGAYGPDDDAAGPGGDYSKVSDLVPLPEYIPGMGTLYVQPDTLPAGPFLAYDRDGELVSTIYMIPLADMNAKANWNGLAARDLPVESVDVAYNPGHPGVAEPHYHITLWHVARSAADLE